jgi:transposase
MYHTTGFSREEITDLVAIIHHHVQDVVPERRWPPSLGLYRCTCITLAYLRRNHVQQELAERFDTSQPTVSRAVAALTSLIGEALSAWTPVAEDLDTDESCLVDGTLLPCWSWAGHPELYSGKHKTTGLLVQVVCDLDGNPLWISDPVEGRHHDMHCLTESGVLDTLDPSKWMADKGYQGSGMITPIKKPRAGELHDSDKAFNAQVNTIRSVVERAIANLKTWRILHTDYRRPLQTFRETITATIALHFYRLA